MPIPGGASDLHPDFTLIDLFDWPMIWVLLLLIGVLRALRYRYRKKPISERLDVDCHEVTLDEDTGDEPFDRSLWTGTWQYLWNHGDELEQGAFMNEAYLLFLDALSAKDLKYRVLEHATLGDISETDLLDQETKAFMARLYTPIFQAGGRDITQKHALLESMHQIVQPWMEHGLSVNDNDQ